MEADPKQDWIKDAECKNYPPDTMFPENEGDDLAYRRALDMARRICHVCIVFNACRQYGIENPDEVGVYGGLTQKQRQTYRRWVDSDPRI